MNLNSNQLQNHPKIITVYGRWTPHTIPEQGTMNQGGVGYSALASSFESTDSPLLFHHF